MERGLRDFFLRLDDLLGSTAPMASSDTSLCSSIFFFGPRFLRDGDGCEVEVVEESDGEAFSFGDGEDGVDMLVGVVDTEC